jgi:sulfite oxidase
MVNAPKRLTLGDVQNEELFPRMSRVVTLQCSGTRRIEQIHEYPGEGDELINAPVSLSLRRIKPNTDGILVG